MKNFKLESILKVKYIYSVFFCVSVIGSNANNWALDVNSVTTQLGSSALFTCIIPENVRPFVDVIEWLHDLDKTGKIAQILSVFFVNSLPCNENYI